MDNTLSVHKYRTLYNGTKDIVVYTYGLYKKEGNNYTYIKDMTRAEFEMYRKETNQDFGYAGVVSIRESSTTDDVMIETRSVKYQCIERNNIVNKFKSEFSHNNNIKNTEAFEDFIDQYKDDVGIFELLDTMPDSLIKALQ